MPLWTTAAPQPPRSPALLVVQNIRQHHISQKHQSFYFFALSIAWQASFTALPRSRIDTLKVSSPFRLNTASRAFDEQIKSGVDGSSLPRPDEIWRNRTVAALIDWGRVSAPQLV